MLYFLPCNTDAPLYYKPWATGAMIIVNVVFFIMSLSLPMEWMCLHYGSINPISWFTVHLMHADVGHLVGNMIFFAFCGLIIEGRIGWLRFVILYFAIGVTMAAPVQIAIFFTNMEGYALGASCVISGMIVIAMLWAPEDEITIAYGGVFFFRPFWGTFQITVLVAGFFLIGMDFIKAAFRGFELGTSVFHLLGVAAGLPFAYLMIKYRQVNCDGKDMFSLWSGNYGKVVLTKEQAKERKVAKKKKLQETNDKIDEGLKKVAFYIDNGHYDMAIKRMNMIRRDNHDLQFTENQLITIIKGYDKDPKTKHKVIPIIRTYLENYETYRIPFTLMLARTQVLVLERPRQGLATLQGLNWNELNPKQQSFVRKLIERGKAMIADGVLEIDV